MTTCGRIMVSVIVPVYNVEPYLRKCLDSLLGQTLPQIEIIVIDDGSPDNCASIIDEYAKKDNRIKAIHKKNGGVSAARNDGIKQIQGKYVFFCDSDDWLETDALESMVNRAEETECDVLISDFCEAKTTQNTRRKVFSNEFVADDKETLSVIQATVLPKGFTALSCKKFKRGYCLGAPWHHLIRASVILDNHIIFDTYVRGMFDDGLFMLNVFEYAKRVAYLSKVTYNYRVVEGSITHRFNPAILETYHRVYQKIEEFAEHYHKSGYFYNAYYLRIIGYLNKAMKVYFMNPDNSALENERYNKFLTIVSSDPYVEAIKAVKIKSIYSWKTKILVGLLKMKQYKIYWRIKKHI